MKKQTKKQTKQNNPAKRADLKNEKKAEVERNK